MKIQLQHYEIDYILKYSKFLDISTLSELWKVLSSSRRSTIYRIIDRVISLVLTLLISITFIEPAFSPMMLVKTRLHNKMEDEFLANTLTIY